jgi:cytochrome c oxidase subunit 2
MLQWLGLPEQASAHAAEIDNMIVLVHWLMAVLFVGWGTFFVYTLIRFRASRQPRASYTGATTHFSTYVEVGVALIEAILLVGFSIPAWAARVDQIPDLNEAIVVRVVAEQFAWNMHYPGPDRVFGRTDQKLIAADNPLGLDRMDAAAKDDITTINQLNMPVNRPVVVHLSSKDVIHSFSLNEMRVKQDAIPGVTFPVWFVPTKTGSWEINCSQLCGLGHYRMRGFYAVTSQQEYDAWLKEQATSQ